MKREKFLRLAPWKAYHLLSGTGLTNVVPDGVHLKLVYKAVIGRSLDLERPQGFNEKLQWLKLRDRNPLYTMLVDKHRVKGWVADKIGPQYVAETYAAWDRAEDIDVSGLPERFVLKTNHDCGGVAVCRDKASFDLGAAKKKLAKHLKTNYFWGGREWPYKNVKPLVFAEQYLEPDITGDIPDYKLFRFSNGRILTLVCAERSLGAGMKKTFFDEGWSPVGVSEGGHPTDPSTPRPEHFDEMKRLAGKIAGDFPFARVDFYESGGRLWFGEVTFYPNSGFEHFEPASFDELLGDWIDLSRAYGA